MSDAIVVFAIAGYAAGWLSARHYIRRKKKPTVRYCAHKWTANCPGTNIPEEYNCRRIRHGCMNDLCSSHCEGLGCGCTEPMT